MTNGAVYGLAHDEPAGLSGDARSQPREPLIDNDPAAGGKKRSPWVDPLPETHVESSKISPPTRESVVRQGKPRMSMRHLQHQTRVLEYRILKHV